MSLPKYVGYVIVEVVSVYYGFSVGLGSLYIIFCSVGESWCSLRGFSEFLR